MENYQNKIKLRLSFIALGVLLAFAYAVYLVWGQISYARVQYIEKYTELISLEEKQGLSKELQVELAKTATDREEVVQALLRKEDVLKFIERVEDIAKRAGLSHEVKILRETTREDIEKERTALARTRGKAKDEALEAIKKRLPGVTFNVSMGGLYSGIVRFLEGIGTLPYYTHVERLDLSSGRGGDEEVESATLEASIQLTVFIME